jgi:hypothetical protein
MSQPVLQIQPATENKIAETESTSTRRAFLGVATAAGLCYAGAIGYPVYRYLASPAEMAANETAVTEVALDKAQDLPVASALMFKFGSSPAMLIHGADGLHPSRLHRQVRAGAQPHSLLLPRRSL